MRWLGLESTLKAERLVYWSSKFTQSQPLLVVVFSGECFRGPDFVYSFSDTATGLKHSHITLVSHHS